MPNITQQDVLLESAKSVRRCKACSHPVKGHPGPFGLTRCRNREEGGSAGTKVLEQEIVELVTAFEAVDVDIKTPFKDIVKGKVTNPACGSLRDIPISEDDHVGVERHEVGHNLILVDSNKLSELEAKGENGPCMKKLVSDSDDTDDDQGKGRLTFEAFIRDDETISNEDSLLSNGEEFSQKIDDIVARLEESLLEDVKEATDEVPAPPLDIRTILSEGQFCICKCPPGSDVAACECEGELLLDRNMSGVVNKVYLDPVEFKQDWKPRVKCGARGWSKDNPGVIMLHIEKLQEEGVKVLEGKLNVEAFLAKEGDEVNGVVRGTMSMVVEVGKQLLKKGFKNPVSFKPIHFQLIRFEEEV